MPTVERVDGTPLAVTAAYQTLAALLGDPNFRGRILDGSLQAQTGGLTVLYRPDGKPDDATGGQSLSSGQSITFGPVFHVEAAWAIEHIWIRRTAAGTPAEVSPLLAVLR